MTLVVIDTNVIVYRYDATDDAKRRAAASLLRHLSQTGMGLLPAQCLAELSSRRIAQVADEPDHPTCT